nr:MAG TPA: hypothetical protein [Caudoviricetes sp.]
MHNNITTIGMGNMSYCLYEHNYMCSCVYMFIYSYI